jgi:glycosyltransferase involved in cell wall biosynthesis
MISALVLTLNEEANLPACLASLTWCDDVVVLDSFSTDRTVAIAEEFGARVVRRNFDDWATHQNWAARNITFKHSWVYYSDADEVVPEALRQEMLSVVDKPGPEVAYRLRFKNYFMGRWLKHSSLYPTWALRLYRPEKVCWERLVNPVPVVSGPEGRLNEHFLHFSFNKGFNAWFDKHNKYSWQEAQESLKSLRGGRVSWLDVFSLEPARRRRALKELSFRLPFRPSLRFLYMYVLRRGFLDGWAGLTYCRLLAMYEYMIVLKMKEIRRRELGLPV